MSGTVLVTGGTGYIGGEVIDQLLAKGYTVHTTVRNKAKSEPALRTRWSGAGDRLKVFQADLVSDDGWAEANAGCDAVAHVASPIPAAPPKHEDDLVVPAREGTLRALRFAKEAGVKRFVQTSSMAAIAYGRSDKVYSVDESDWTDVTHPDVYPYVKSKTIAERAARDWVGENGGDMEFVSVNPSMVLGPVESADFPLRWKRLSSCSMGRHRWRRISALPSSISATWAICTSGASRSRGSRASASWLPENS